MSLLEWMGLRDSDEEIEYDEDTIKTELSKQFTRKTVKFRFVRGSDIIIDYDVWEKRGEQIESVTADRAGTTVKQYQKVTGARPIKWHDGSGLDLKIQSEVTDEVTPGNVTHRETLSEQKMEIAVPVELTVKRHPETGETVSRGIPIQLDDEPIQITEVDNE